MSLQELSKQDMAEKRMGEEGSEGSVLVFMEQKFIKKKAS